MVLVEVWVTCLIIVLVLVVVGVFNERQLHAEDIAAAFRVLTLGGAVHVEARLARRNSSLLHYSVSSEPQDVAILGGGITGLASAYYLSQSIPSTKITIYEAGSRIGGWLSSKRVAVDDGDILFESGPRTLRPAGNGVLMGRLVNDLGLQDDTIFTFKSAPAATNRFLYYPDHLVRVPAPNPSLGLVANAAVIADTFSREEAFRGLLWRAALEYFQPTRSKDLSDESIGHFFSRRLGSKMVDRVLSSVIHGIYAGDVYQLSMKSLFPGLWRLEGESGSLLGGFMQSFSEGPKLPRREASFGKLMKQPYPMDKDFKKNLGRASVFTFRNGLQQLVDKLEEKLRERSNVTFLTNSGVKSVDMADGNARVWLEGSSDTDSVSHTHVISTLSPKHNQQVLFKPGSVLKSKSFRIAPAPTVMTVSLYYKTPDLHPPGFGYLIPRETSSEQNPERALGVVFDTAYSPSSVLDPDFAGPLQDFVEDRGTKLTVMLGGHYWDGWTGYPTEEEGLQMAKSVLKRHLNISEEPAVHSINLQRDCIPQYTVGYEDRLKVVHNELLQQYSGKVRVAGNWIKGVGVNDCLRSAWDVIRELRDERKTGLESVVEEKDWISVQPPLLKSKPKQ
ncbi:hypothetical protein MBLNU459_g4467t3 [Dothideomycetes sp. NU459]